MNQKLKIILAELKDVEFTKEDVSKFTPRGSFATQLEDSIGDVMMFVGADVREYTPATGDVKSFTRLKFQNESDAKKIAYLTLAFDAQNIFLSDDENLSLKQIGMGNGGEDAKKHLGMFTIDKIEGTNEYPFKYSRASEKLDISPFSNPDQDDWAKLRTLYNSDPKMRKGRKDMESAWKEIKNVYITPID